MMTILRRAPSSSHKVSTFSALIMRSNHINKARYHRQYQHRRVLSIAAVAALSTTTGHAWVQKSRQSALSPSNSIQPLLLSSSSNHRFSTTSSSTRLYHSSPLRQRRSKKNSNKDDDDSGGDFLSQLGKAAKSIMPKSWFGSSSSEEEKAQLARKQQVKDQVQGSLDEFLKEAPLGVRMMGKMVAPLMGNLVSTMAEGLAEQQRTTEMLLEDARRYLLNDPNVDYVLGLPIQMGVPFSQSSSMSTINGQTQSRVELALNIVGSKRSGIARIMATQDGISELLVESGGMVVNVSLSSKKGGGGGTYKRSLGRKGDDDNIIEAEIIDKDTTTTR